MSSGEYEEVTLPYFAPYLVNRKSRSLDYGHTPLFLNRNVPEGWTYDVNEFGEEIFVDNLTKQQVC